MGSNSSKKQQVTLHPSIATDTPLTLPTDPTALRAQAIGRMARLFPETFDKGYAKKLLLSRHGLDVPVHLIEFEMNIHGFSESGVMVQALVPVGSIELIMSLSDAQLVERMRHLLSQCKGVTSGDVERWYPLT